MKTKSLIMCAATLLVASCANDELVVQPNKVESAPSPMAFGMRVGNQGRADTPLNDVVDNFGVWAIKTATGEQVYSLDAATLASQTVMPNYKVEYTATKTSYDANWTYELTTPAQYLKYWDGSFDKTYFFCYTPYSGTGVTFNNGYVDGTNDNGVSITWNTAIAAGTTSNVMYAAKVENNADHIGTTTKVEPKFKRMLSQIQLAFYEVVPGYNVEIKSVDFAAGTGGTPAASTNRGIVLIPAKDDLSARGTYTYSGIPTVTFDKTTPETTAAVTWASVTTKDVDLDFASAMFTAPTGGTAVTNIPSRDDSEDGYAYSQSKAGVLPCASGNCGFQIVISFDLKSKDTGEVIKVRGARAWIPATYTQWAANTVYTYVFKITSATTGTTTTNNPTDQPVTPSAALYPIIFDNVVIEEISGVQQPDININ